MNDDNGDGDGDKVGGGVRLPMMLMIVMGIVMSMKMCRSMLSSPSPVLRRASSGLSQVTSLIAACWYTNTNTNTNANTSTRPSKLWIITGNLACCFLVG